MKPTTFALLVGAVILAAYVIFTKANSAGMFTGTSSQRGLAGSGPGLYGPGSGMPASSGVEYS